MGIISGYKFGGIEVQIVPKVNDLISAPFVKILAFNIFKSIGKHCNETVLVREPAEYSQVWCFEIPNTPLKNIKTFAAERFDLSVEFDW